VTEWSPITRQYSRLVGEFVVSLAFIASQPSLQAASEDHLAGLVEVIAHAAGAACFLRKSFSTALIDCLEPLRSHKMLKTRQRHLTE